MFIFYDFLYLLLVIIYLPAYLLKRKFHAGFSRRFGFLSKEFIFQDPIWIHAVSVGEIIAARMLVQKLREVFPAKQIVFSTVTPTGNKIAQTLARKGDLVTYLPFDFSFIVGRVIRKIKPCLFVIVETEIWPNLISVLEKNKIPVIAVNARISDKSFRGYRVVRFLLQKVLNKIALFCVQTSSDKKKLEELGVSQDKIKLTGNMKFDLESKLTSLQSEYRQKLNIGADERVLVCGSTHNPEEGYLFDIYARISAELKNLRLIVAPRHPERADEVAGLARHYGLEPLKLTQIKDAIKPPLACAKSIIIIDTVGDLFSFYQLADLVFVGGSLIKKGGHNILEPAALAKPVIFGPYMFNFQDIADLFIAQNACIQAAGKEELATAIKGLLRHPEEMKELGIRAQELLARNRGATENNFTLIRDYVKSSL